MASSNSMEAISCGGILDYSEISNIMKSNKKLKFISNSIGKLINLKLLQKE